VSALSLVSVEDRQRAPVAATAMYDE